MLVFFGQDKHSRRVGVRLWVFSSLKYIPEINNRTDDLITADLVSSASRKRLVFLFKLKVKKSKNV